ncbi:ThuA domain-containing protein [Microbacterium sp. cx-59]|uniref:ThuA domain-containing protein n=1 Tax=Microbacterium sp. cx-59 TaxID=2891207 RepID=UPI001E65929E|nr:ThuA domain-containing protein [Microbacterium sp. cx-59]MCC4908374.1 ThuA domain-containing protein [Microbacterium sp. cx-59]
MTRAVVFSGGGDYVDPWHPFAETSAIAADVLRADGFDVDIVDRVDALARVLPGADLLVVNAGGGPEPHPLDPLLASALDGLRGGLLVLHVAATLLPEDDGWEARLGGRWVRGTTMHPERGPMELRAVVADSMTEGIDPLRTSDEAYSWLRVGDGVRVLYVQEHGGQPHPVVWTIDRDGVRAAYDALGHDAEAYDAPAVRELLRRLARWAAVR